MNLSELRAQTKTYLMNTSTDTDSLSWSDAELDSYINEAAFYVQELGEFFIDTKNLPVSSNTATYSVADNQQQLIRTTFDRNFLAQTNEYELDRDTRSTWRNQTASTPKNFYIPQFNQVTLWPPPNADGAQFTFAQEAGELVQIAGISTALASDNFNRANQNPLTSPWVTFLNAPKLISNQVEPTVLFPGNGSFAYYSGTFPANQYSKFTVGALQNFTMSTSSALAAVVRFSPGTTADKWYQAAISASGEISVEFQTLSHPSSTITSVLIADSFGNTINPGDTVQLNAINSVDGTFVTLTVVINGVPVVSGTHGTGYITGGNPGIGLAAITTLADAILDNWEAGSVSIADDYTVTSELGIVTQVYDNQAPYSLFKLDEGATGSLNPEFGLVVDYASDEGNIGTIFVGVIPELVEDADVPLIPEYSHPAIPMYAVARALARDGEFQDLNLASSWFDAFKDWMDASLNVRGKEWPFTVTSLEPWQKGNDLNRRLQSVGLPGFIRQ